MARVNVDILGIHKLKWTEMSEFNSDDHYIYYCWQQSLKRNGVAIIVNKRVWNAVIGCSLKNDRMISVHFQGKPFNIMVIQVDALTSNTEEAEAEWFYEDLQDLLELTTKKRCPFHYRGLECKSRKWEILGITGKFGLGVQNEAGKILIEFCQENVLVRASTWITMILNGLPWKWTEIILSFLRLHPRTAFQTLTDYEGYSISSKGFLPTVIDIMVIWVKFTHSSPF